MLPYCQIQTEIEESREDTRPFRYDLNQIPYNYTVEVTNRFEGLGLINRVPDELAHFWYTEFQFLKMEEYDLLAKVISMSWIPVIDISRSIS